MLSSPIGRVRLVGMVEGASFVALLGIAMPLKYFADLPMAVRIVGMAHGVLFLAYLAVIFLAVRNKAWPGARAPMLVVASLLPFGPFFVDGQLRDRERELGASTSDPKRP
ncbi:MAG: DUF3817 domain-containing protein [Polyangiaceae bacterium]|nr:DUF3817 domain-containing protein [Polyangiaceae bacterium]